MESKVGQSLPLNSNFYAGRSASTLKGDFNANGKGGPKLGIDEKSLENQMKQLGNATRNVKAAKKIARNKDTISQLIDALKTKPKFTKMVEYSIECLKNLAVDEVSIEEMLDEGVLSVLDNVSKLNPYNEKIQQMISKTLAQFALNEKLAADIGEKMGAKGIIFSLQKHVEGDTLSTTLQATAKLMKAKGNIEMFTQGGMIGAVKHVMKNQEENLDVLVAATDVLNKIVSSDKKFAAEIMESGVVADVVAALSHYPESAILVENGLSFLNRMAESSAAIKGQLQKVGAVDTLLGAIECHPDNERVLALGAIALRHLAGESDLKSAFHIQTGNNEATAAALSKLSSLLLVDENVDYLIQNQGIGWLIAALQSAVGDPSETASKILASGTRALMRLATDENKIYGIMQQGGVKLLISILNQHSADENVSDASLRALGKMVTRKENATYIIKSGGIPAAQAALAAHPQSEKISRAALDLFNKIAVHEDCVPQLISSGAIKSVLEISKRFSGNALVQGDVIRCLGRMGINAANLENIIREAGGKVLVSILNDHKEDPLLSRQAMLLLESAALVPSNAGPLRDAGAAAAIYGVMEANPNDKDLNAIGQRAMAILAGDDQVKLAADTMGKLVANPSSQNISVIIDRLLASTANIATLASVDDNVIPLIKNGAVAKLIAAFNAAIGMSAGENKSKLMASSAAGLLRLNKTPEVAAQIMQSGAIKGMLKAALNDKGNEELAQHVAQLISQLSSDPKNVSILVKDGSIEDLISLARAYPLNEKILAAVTKAIGNLCSTEDAARKAALAGASDVVVESMFANLENPELLTSALNVLNQLAVDDSSIQSLLDAGAIDAILEAMRVHHDKPEILQLCCQSLCRLLISEQVAKDIGTKGGLPLCVRSMRDHYKSEPLCEVDMILMDSLASIPENTTRLLEPELATVELIKWIGKQYPNNSPLVEAMKRLLSSLTQEDKKGKSFPMTNENIHFDEAMCDEVLAKCKNAKNDPNGAVQALQAVLQSLYDPNNAAMMIAKGGLQTLADIINNSKDNENLFYAASAAFLALTENGGDGVHQLLENPSIQSALCNMMNAHDIFKTPMNLSDLTRAIKTTARIKMKEKNVNNIVGNKPLNSLMRILMQSDDPLLLAQASKLLGKLSNNNDAALLLSKLANLRELIQALRRNIKNEEFLKYGVYLLGNLAVNEELKSQIGIEGGIQVILQIMELYPNNEGLIENCSYALANLSFGNEVNCSFIVACKGVQTLLSAMANHPKSEELLESTVCVLCNLCHKNDNNRDLIIKSGGAQAIVDTVLNNFNAIELLLTAFRTLGNLAYNPSSTSSIIKAGGVQGIVAGMTVHNDNLDIIDISIRVLTNLASEPTEESMKIMAQEGAVQAIVEVCQTYTDKVEIEIAALGCLCNLGRQLDNATMIIKQNGTEACIAAMKKHDNDINLIANGMRLLNVLAHSRPAEIERMHEAPVTASIVSALKKHFSSRTVISNALMATTHLSFNGDIATKMGAFGIIQAVLRVVQDSSKTPQTLSEAFPALSALARSEGNAVAMSELAMKAILGAIQNHNADVKFLCFAFSFLSNLCVHSDATVAVLDCPVVMATIDTLHRHKGEPVLLLRGLRSLENMCYSTNEVKDHLKSCGLVDAMNKVIEDNISNDDVRSAAKAVLDALNREELSYTPLAPKVLPLNQTVVKSARGIFDDQKSGNKEITELPQWVKNLLQSGALLNKHSMNAPPRPRHVYVTTDLKFLVWKDPKKPLHPDNKMKIFKIRSIERGRCTEQLQRTRFGKHLAKEECSFAIIGRDRTVDLETPREADREKWVEALELLVAYRKAMKKVNTQFGQLS